MDRMLLVVLAGLAVALPAQAQTDVQAGLMETRAQCMGLPTDSERLACLNAALDRLGSSLEAQPSPPAAAPVAAPPPTGELGAEQVAVRQEGRRAQPYSPDPVQAVIVSMREPVPGQMVLELDNGQVWRQIDGDSRGLYFVAGDAPVEITRARLGGYRMTLIDQRKMLRVERLR